MIKKSLWVFLFFGICMFSFVTAAYQPARGLADGLGLGVQQIIEIVENVIGPVTEAVFGDSEFLFEKVLFLVVIISIVYVVLKQIPTFNDDTTSQKSIRWILTIAVGLLSTRFLIGSEMVMTAILPYNVLGIVLTSVLPFIIYFFFVSGVFPYNEKNPAQGMGRKLMWIFFGIVFIGVWGSNYDEASPFSWIYFFTALGAFLLFLLDGPINRMMVIAWYGEKDNHERQLQIGEVEIRIREYEDKRRNQPNSTSLKAWEKEIARLEKHKKILVRTLGRS